MDNYDITGVDELNLQTLTVTGDVEVSGALNAESLVSTGTTELNVVTLNDASITSLIAEKITSDEITAGTASVARLTTPTLVSTSAEVETLSARSAEVQTLKSETGDFLSLTIDGRLKTTSIITQSLTTGSCSGC